MTPMVFILALLLHRPLPLVEAVYRAGGVDAVAVVESESWFSPRALKVERDREGKRIGTSWGLFQLFDLYHPQHRDDLQAHIIEGVAFLLRCERAAGWNFARAISVYNSGDMHTSIEWGKYVRGKRDSLMHRAIRYLSRRQ